MTKNPKTLTNATPGYFQLKEPQKYSVLMREASARGWSNRVDDAGDQRGLNYASREISEVRSTPCEADTEGRNFIELNNEGIFIESASAVNAMHRRSVNNTKVIVGIGRFLTLKKKEIGHGDWLDWLKQNITFSHDWSTRYMRCYEHRAEILKRGLTITVKACLDICNAAEGKRQKKEQQLKVASEKEMRRDLERLRAKYYKQADAEHVNIVTNNWLTVLSDMLNEEHRI